MLGAVTRCEDLGMHDEQGKAGARQRGRYGGSVIKKRSRASVDTTDPESIRDSVRR
jgi:hypothetical protein